ncbi:MAG: hypothetical protein LBV80_03030 [Deltaproteobacteria bacterium]|nr:hypothetical protein [Deltaproteobacteria bacterium]
MIYARNQKNSKTGTRPDGSGGTGREAALTQSIRTAALPGVVLIGLFMLLNLVGCAGSGEKTRFEIASQPVVYTDYEILRDPPVVHVQPVSEASGVKVLFVPFRVTQQMDNSELVGYSITKMFWQNWAALGVFEYMEYAPEAGPFSLGRALALARSRGADMVVSGYVTHFLSGSSIAGSSLSVQLEGYDTSSGILVWSMAQGAAIARPQSNDYMLFSTRPKMPDDPIYAITAAMAKDMGEIMRGWSRAEEIRAEEARLAQEAEEERLRQEQQSITDRIGTYVDEFFDSEDASK